MQSLFLDSAIFSATCVWDEIDDRLAEIDRVCCAQNACDQTPAGTPEVCSPMCSIAFHGFMAQCSTSVDSLANAQALETFDAACVNAGAINVPLFIDALSSAQCCSSRNCNGCVDAGQCAAVGSSDVSGAAHQCYWAGEPHASLGALVSEGKQATQSSLRSASDSADKAVDGGEGGNFFDGSCTHTQANSAWWQVDLGASFPITHVDIYHRTDCCEDRLIGAAIIVSTSPGVLQVPGLVLAFACTLP
eukprot:SAG31_NODE_3925_length_3746_cov_2.099260_3_plen_247_part_00